MYLKVSIIECGEEKKKKKVRKCLLKMNTLTVTNIKFLCKCYLPSFCTAGHFKLQKNRNQAQHLYSSPVFNTFIMLDWGALKQLHSTFMNTGSCLVSAFMQCSCFFMSFGTQQWNDVSVQEAVKSKTKVSLPPPVKTTQTR